MKKLSGKISTKLEYINLIFAIGYIFIYYQSGLSYRLELNPNRALFSLMILWIPAILISISLFILRLLTISDNRNPKLSIILGLSFIFPILGIIAYPEPDVFNIRSQLIYFLPVLLIIFPGLATVLVETFNPDRN